MALVPAAQSRARRTERIRSRERTVRRALPRPLLLALAPRIGMTREYVRRNVGFPVRCDATRSRTELGVRYRPAQKSLEAMVEQMLPRRSPTA